MGFFNSFPYFNKPLFQKFYQPIAPFHYYIQPFLQQFYHS